ncbi:MAG: hypothetical protein LUG50_13310 [Planctomycetaceae bacterium]|nr:hypothetical protein [Planctomycetaceae bacterium]
MSHLKVGEFIKGRYCDYFPLEIKSLRTRAVLPIFEDLPPHANFAIMSLRYNGDYHRETIAQEIREKYGYVIREIVGEFTYKYGVFAEHYIVVFNRKDSELISHIEFRKDIAEVGRIIIKGKALLADTSLQTFEHIMPNGESFFSQVKNVTRKNAIQWQFGQNFKLSLCYNWSEKWIPYPRELGLHVLGRLWSEDNYPRTHRQFN